MEKTYKTVIENGKERKYITVLIKCVICNKEFYRRKNQIPKSGIVYCSKKCRYNNDGKWLNKVCINCGNKYSVKPSRVNSKCCSRNCWCNYRKCIRNCKNCNKLLKNRQKLFCSIKCQHKYYAKNKIGLGIAGIRLLKKTLYEKSNKCNICGISEWNGINIMLELNHIDGNSMNNNIENLELICPNCHSQTPTYKGKNKGNGRFYRAQRYRDGKSH